MIEAAPNAQTAQACTARPPPASSASPTTATPAGSRATTRWSIWLPAGAILFAFALSFVLRMGLQQQWPMPFCWLRKLTSLPCPACGSTRSLAAWSNLDLAQALSLNPLFFAICIAGLLWAVGRALEKTCGFSWLPRIQAVFDRRGAWIIIALLAGLNWVYLWATLPE